MGSVVNRGTKDQPAWYGRFKDLDGRMKQKHTKQMNKAAALGLVAEWEARVARGLPAIAPPTDPAVAARALTFRELAEKFIKEYSRPKIRNLKRYRRQFGYAMKARVFPHRIANIAVGAVRPADVEALRDDMKAKGYENSTINQTLVKVKTVYSWALDREIITGKNPAKKIEMMPESPSEEHFTRDEVERLLHPRCCMPMIATAIYTGMRKGELFGLTWARVFLDASPPRIEVKTSYDTGATKTGKDRTVPIHPELKLILGDWQKKCPPTDEGLVFPIYRGDKGGRYRPGREWDMEDLRLVLDGAGCSIPKHPWHAMRHTFITQLTEAGASIAAVERIVGHAPKGSAITAGYTHVGLPFLARELGRLSFAVTPERAEEIARQIEDRVQQLRQRKTEGPLLLAGDVAVRIGYGRDTKGQYCFRAFVKRHPDLGALAVRMGHRLHWPAVALEAWLQANPKWRNQGKVPELEARGLMSSKAAALALGFVRPNGEPAIYAFHAFKARTPDFAAHAVAVGRRWFYPGDVVRRWALRPRGPSRFGGPPSWSGRPSLGSVREPRENQARTSIA